ncbi:MAG: DUF4082 domain-containing protein, partial [Acidimicrobiaceae bacterium]|nr:DUF4082 domain-containing protein [Acidimicrobiaceae bacterium]
SLLASVTFTGETASGWQQASFSTPVAVTAGTTYVVSYFAPTGHYSATSNAFAVADAISPPLYALGNNVTPNGVFAYGSTNSFPSSSYRATNYWVDPIFGLATPGTPTGVAGAAGNGASTVSWTAPASGASPISSYTVTPYIGSTAQTPTTVTGSPPATTATISGLTNGTTYTFTVTATNANGTGLASASSNQVTPQASYNCPCTIFGTATPATPDAGDASAVNLGLKFTTDTNGFITGVRFYKAAANTGTHVGSLWTASGSLLASVTFTGETASGWQQASFSTPVAVTAGTTYVVSYFAPAGHYSATSGAFTTSGLAAPPLYALANTTSANGVFAYGSTSVFPTSSFNASNYWVDPVFSQ